MNTSALVHLPASGDPELLYLLFHGVGATAEHMLPLARRLIAEYPQAAVLCVNAPDRFDAVIGETEGKQWFSIRRVDEDNRPGRVQAALPAFIATVRALQQRFGVGWERTALAGFSQGAVMSLEAVQAEPQLAGRVLAFSGRHATAPTHVPIDTTVHLFHGLADTVIPAAAAIDSAQTLLELGGDVTADVLPAIAHELHPQLLDKAIEQLRSFLPKRVWREVMSEAPVLPRAASSDELGGGDERRAMATPCDIRVVDPQGADAMALLHDAACEARALYPDLIPADAPAPRNAPTGARSVYLVAHVDGVPAACGALRPIDAQTGEVRRMFVRSPQRRQGLARAVLDDLERHAATFGFTALRLETGNRQHAAMALYEAQGFQRIAPYGEHVDDPTSVCYEKSLRATPG